MMTGETVREAGAHFAMPPARFSHVAPLIAGSALLMQGIDGTAIIVALPSMAQAMDTNILYINLAVSAYPLCIVVFCPSNGLIGERFGARPAFAERLPCSYWLRYSVARPPLCRS
ncbi:MAG: hypothetical protein J7517_08640 [Sphingobium yanoikuyae]|nr:hypothetical protein [Sphingobium yanoikuyae]